ncbi:GNAT family N-acetyltransferase [Jannaschia formosa]|uniref:GNAT family N-acetyltransferase n=1 Tax=Jannaschia formosa TaxID=2259592 RepID=UPI001FD7993F|nr:GNAT family N-acetyltransferase [Jannaschia formosa]
MLLSLRPATPADLPSVDMLLAASYPRLLAADYPPSVLVTALPRICRARPELLASGTYHLAFEGETLVACGGWTRARPTGGTEPGLGHVRHVAAHPDHLRRGHARRLMEHCLAEARAAGMRALDCFSTRTARRARRSRSTPRSAFAASGPSMCRSPPASPSLRSPCGWTSPDTACRAG